MPIDAPAEAPSVVIVEFDGIVVAILGKKGTGKCFIIVCIASLDYRLSLLGW